MIALGSQVKDIITGLTGVAIARTEWLYGCHRIAIESVDLKKDGKPSDSIWVDEQRVEKLDGPSFAATVQKPCLIKLGSKVRDSLTGFEGIASARTECLYSNTTITIEPTKLYEGKPAEGHCFEVTRIELIQESAPPVSKSSVATSGGPQHDPKIK